MRHDSLLKSPTVGFVNKHNLKSQDFEILVRWIDLNNLMHEIWNKTMKPVAFDS